MEGNVKMVQIKIFTSVRNTNMKPTWISSLYNLDLEQYFQIADQDLLTHHYINSIGSDKHFSPQEIESTT